MSATKFTYKTSGGVCASRIDIEIDGDAIVSVKFTGGCDGNAKGVAALARGMKTADAIARLKGINCGGKSTSCPDQLARALASVSATGS